MKHKLRMKCKNNTFVTINQILWLKLFISLVGQWVRQRITRICDNELTRIFTNFFVWVGQWLRRPYSWMV